MGFLGQLQWDLWLRVDRLLDNELTKLTHINTKKRGRIKNDTMPKKYFLVKFQKIKKQVKYNSIYFGRLVLRIMLKSKNMGHKFRLHRGGNAISKVYPIPQPSHHHSFPKPKFDSYSSTLICTLENGLAVWFILFIYIIMYPMDTLLCYLKNV